MKNTSTAFRVLLGCCFWLAYSCGHAQIDCDGLDDAVLNYEKGNLDEVIRQLESCLSEKDLSDESRWRAYKFMAEIALYRKLEGEAEGFVVQMLELFPETELDVETEMPELVDLYNSYRVSHDLHWGIKLGGNLTLMQLLKVHSITNTENNAGGYFSRISGTGGLAWDYYLTPQLSLSSEVLFEVTRFSFEQEVLDLARIQAYESQWWAKVPLSLSVHPFDGRVRPYVRTGASFGILILAESRYFRRYINQIKDELESPLVNVRPFRTPFNTSILGGIGCAVRIGRRSLVNAEIRYQHALTRVARAGRRYSSNLDEHFFYVDDDFKLNLLEFSIGCSAIRYQIKKRKPKTNKP